jgi:hypothetical protein
MKEGFQPSTAVPLRADNVVAVLREPGKGEALEADGVELARQTPEQLQLVEDRGKLAIDAVLVRRIEDFHVELEAGAWRRWRGGSPWLGTEPTRDGQGRVSLHRGS